MTVTEAKYLAELFHEGQTRADKVTPYIEHPKKVVELVQKYHGSDHCIALAWVHDILEESADKVKEYFHLSDVTSKTRFMKQMRDRWEHSFIYDLCELSDHWDTAQFDIQEGKGKVAYLAELLSDSNADIVLVKLCDMLANIMESDGSRMSQEKRYYKAVQRLKMAERKDLDERHAEVVAAIEAYYNIHNSKK